MTKWITLIFSGSPDQREKKMKNDKDDDNDDDDYTDNDTDDNYRNGISRSRSRDSDASSSSSSFSRLVNGDISIRFSSSSSKLVIMLAFLGIVSSLIHICLLPSNIQAAMIQSPSLYQDEAMAMAPAAAAAVNSSETHMQMAKTTASTSRSSPVTAAAAAPSGCPVDRSGYAVLQQMIADNNSNNSNDVDDDINATVASLQRRLLLDKTDPMFAKQQKGYGMDPIVIEKYKLLFFDVPKIGSTEWKKLFRRIMGKKNWFDADPHDPEYNGLKYLRDYTPKQQERMMTSPQWTRAIFVRDPMKRLLSAYLNKGFNGHIYFKCCSVEAENLRVPRHQMETHPVWRDQCQSLYDKWWETYNMTRDDFPFDNFVDAFMVQCGDPHWRPQSQRISKQNWAFMNFIGHFENLAADARCLLEKIGAWEEYGSNGWGPNGKFAFFQENNSKHKTSHLVANDKDDLSTFFHDRKTYRKVLDYLNKDYEFQYFTDFFQKPVQPKGLL